MALDFVAGWYGEYDENIFFKPNDHPSSGTNIYLQKLVCELKEKFSDQNIEIHFNVQPSMSRKKKYLILLENISLRPQNYFYSLFNYERIFGWDLNLKHLKQFKYVKYPHDYKVGAYNPNRSVEYCMICSNRNILLGSKNLSLYDKRQEIITYFDHVKTPFELYGSGWNTRFIKPGLADALVSRFLRKVNYFDKIERPCYKGPLEDKQKLLNDTVFNFCYENISRYEGYVSEKIWDSIAAGSIPVYWPSWCVPDDYIPKWAYVDASKYSSPDDLIKILKSISAEEQLEWQKNLLQLATQKQDFIKSDNYIAEIINEISGSLL